MRVKDANHYSRPVKCPDQQKSQREHRALSVSIHANQTVPHVRIASAPCGLGPMPNAVESPQWRERVYLEQSSAASRAAKRCGKDRCKLAPEGGGLSSFQLC